MLDALTYRVPELAIVVPCYNERANVAPLVAKLDEALVGTRWEVIFVDDDSPDGTADEVRRIARSDPRVRCLRRVGRRGLSSAVIEGALSTSAPYLAVMDGDLQHDERRLPEMLKLLREREADLVVGSRHVEGGTAAGLASRWRHTLSEGGTRLAQSMLPVPLTDPMSGFFALPRARFEQLASRLNGQGFKILLDLVLACREPLRIREIPFEFRERSAGESKMDPLVLVQFLGLLIDTKLHGRLPLRFLAFAMVGASGVLVNLAVLLLARWAGLRFSAAQVAGTFAAILSNFWLNNSLTYRNVRLRGRRFWTGLAVFTAVCTLGALANVGIARNLHVQDAGDVLSSAAGAAVGVVWNYAVSATLVWN